MAMRRPPSLPLGRETRPDPHALHSSPAWEEAPPLTLEEIEGAFDRHEESFTIGVLAGVTAGVSLPP